MWTWSSNELGWPSRHSRYSPRPAPACGWIRWRGIPRRKWPNLLNIVSVSLCIQFKPCKMGLRREMKERMDKLASFHFAECEKEQAAMDAAGRAVPKASPAQDLQLLTRYNTKRLAIWEGLFAAVYGVSLFTTNSPRTCQATTYPPSFTTTWGPTGTWGRKLGKLGGPWGPKLGGKAHQTALIPYLPRHGTVQPTRYLWGVSGHVCSSHDPAAASVRLDRFRQLRHYTLRICQHPCEGQPCPAFIYNTHI
jgi:hypothetical protein